MELREFEKLLYIHDTDFDVQERPACRLLQDAAELNPDRTAVIASDRSLSYRELNAEANALGRCLAGAGVKPGTIVAVMTDRDSYAYVSRQGVLKSGGAFLPVDPEYPEDRIRYILEDSHAAFLVATGEVLERRKDLSSCFEDNGIQVVDMKKAVPSFSGDNLDLNLSWDSCAYVIYTSGSTGRPKGVRLTGRNLVNFVEDHEKNLEVHAYLSHCSCSLAIAALTFDVSVMEEFVPLSHGKTVVMATQQQIMDPKALAVPWESAAYVIYTSGSTGKPKGVVLTGKNLVSFVDDNEKNREIQGYTRRGHVSLAIAALTFDFPSWKNSFPSPQA